METRQARSRDVSGRAGLPVLEGQIRTGSSISPAAMTFTQLAEALRTTSWRRPLCLMVDEIQNVDPAARNVLSQLHLGEHKLPIVPVFAGLGSSENALQRCGLSRPSARSVHHVGALAPTEARDAVERMLDAYRVDRYGGDRDWPDWLAGISEGWPQHLHNAMRALAAGLADAGGRLADVDADRVAKIEGELREESYRMRISPEMESARQLLARVLGMLPAEGLRRGQALREIEHAADSADPEWRLPGAMESEEFFDHLVHGGIFQIGPGLRYTCPIPSLRDYIVQLGTEPEPAPDASPEKDGDALPGPTRFDDPSGF